MAAEEAVGARKGCECEGVVEMEEKVAARSGEGRGTVLGCWG